MIWKDYPEYGKTWQKEPDLENAKRKVKEYWKKQQANCLDKADSSFEDETSEGGRNVTILPL